MLLQNKTMSFMRRCLFALAAFIAVSASASAQRLPDRTVKWKTEVVKDASGNTRIVFTGIPSVPLDEIHGTLQWISCVGNDCHSPEELEFDLKPSEIQDAPESAGSGLPSETHATLGSVRGGTVNAVNGGVERSETVYEGIPEAAADSNGLLSLILEAILWGLAMLLTPCVFPMVPMTVSFFIKGEGAGRFKALMYGLFIVLLYTVPISVIIGLTWLLGGSAVTADIFNWLATHWLPNIIFFVVFMLFAASFFGAFELVMPSKLVNSSDRKSERGGLGGVFFMALTLVLVSFSCTGPIVGTVLIKSTSGEFWAPMIAMLAFSIAFALPFTLLALFPALLKGLPRSGGWLNSVKVVLGFVEVALGFKFLSVADQTYHWGILDREVYLAIWIVCFALLGFYLLGKIRFKYDDKVEHIGIGRLGLAIAVFSFVVYMIPGMFGAPLKALSGYLPPMETQDFVLSNRMPGPAPETHATIKMPHGLKAYINIDDALAEARATGRKVFVDITGHGCVNCREMEARVWSDPKVQERLKSFVMVALYTDDKAKLPESQWITTSEGKVLKDVGRINSYIARTRFGVNAQPNYFILDADGKILSGPRGYNLSIPGFLEFLDGNN